MPKARRVALGVFVAIILSVGASAADWPGPWTELASDGTLSVRIAVAAGTACPKATADEIELPMAPRTVRPGSCRPHRRAAPSGGRSHPPSLLDKLCWRLP